MKRATPGSRLPRKTVLVGSFLVLTVLAACMGAPSAPTLEVVSVQELGVVGKPATVTARDVGGSARIGNRVLWLFGDTLFTPKSVDGTNLRSSTAAWADPARPLEVTEPTDANGAPGQFVPFTTEELAFNAGTGTPQDRIALWTGTPIADGADGIAWFLKTHVRSGFLKYEHRGVGVIRVAVNQTVGVREPALVFGPTEPLFVNPARFGSDVYVYGNRGYGGGNPLVVARVPLAQVAQRSAYRFWNGTDWVSDVSSATTLFFGVPGELSVSWNAHLGAYLVVYSDVLAGKVMARLASAPQGPWSDPVVLFTMRPAQTKSGFSYAGREHPDLARDNGKILFVTYYQPIDDFRGELRAVQVNLH